MSCRLRHGAKSPKHLLTALRVHDLQFDWLHGNHSVRLQRLSTSPVFDHMTMWLWWTGPARNNCLFCWYERIVTKLLFLFRFCVRPVSPLTATFACLIVDCGGEAHKCGSELSDSELPFTNTLPSKTYSHARTQTKYRWEQVNVHTRTYGRPIIRYVTNNSSLNWFILIGSTCRQLRNTY